MSQRKLRLPRFPFVNKGKLGRLELMHRSYVFAGETCQNIKADMKLATLPVKFGMMGATVDVWFYYVPMRLVWDEFPEWRMGNGGTIPTQNPDARIFQELGSDPRFVGRAYELIVNTFFRTDEDGEYTYANDQPMAVMPNVDMTGEGRGVLGYDDLDETIDVSGGTLSLSDVAQARAKLAYDRRMELMDGKYFNMLREQGVRISDQMADIPEFLGHYRKYVEPSKTVDQSSGFTVQSYVHNAKMEFNKRRYFPEDGLVLGCVSIRPKALARRSVVPERAWTDPHLWPHKGQLQEHKKGNWPGSNNLGGMTSDTVVQSVDDYLFHGHHLARGIAADKYFAVFDPDTLANFRLPEGLYDSVPVDGSATNDLSGDHFVVDGIVKTKVATPLSHWAMA
jgi:hypothetical protein